MDGTVLKITGLTPRLEMEIEELLATAAIETRCFGGEELFATFDGEGRASGLACALRRGTDCILRFVVVRPDARRGGVGSALVNHVLGYFAGRGERLYAVAGGAVPFFERFGFRRVLPGELPDSVARASAAGRGSGGAEEIVVIDLPGAWTVP